MATVLHIESSTLTCSVAVARNGVLLALCESHDVRYAHSEKLALFIDRAIRRADLVPKDLDAVCVAKGPGSYTGLRIGVSSAKGLCYGLGIPLLSVDSLESMARWAMNTHANTANDIALLCPMIDARRMEVYSALYDLNIKEVKPVSAMVMDEKSFAAELDSGKMLLFGDGAAKCRDVIQHPNAVYLEDFRPSARGMMAVAEQKLSAGELEDVAYFEPYYLKEFVAGKPKRMFK